MANRDARPRRQHPLGDKGLAIVLTVLFLGTWVAQFVFEIVVVRNQAHDHGQSFQWSQFWPEFW